jgi:hypothetical protein
MNSLIHSPSHILISLGLDKKIVVPSLISFICTTLLVALFLQHLPNCGIRLLLSTISFAAVRVSRSALSGDCDYRVPYPRRVVRLTLVEQAQYATWWPDARMRNTEYKKAYSCNRTKVLVRVRAGSIRARSDSGGGAVRATS